MSTAKFKELVHYVCEQCDDPKKLGATKLNKVLWYTDTIAYRVLGKTVSGEDAYIKRQFGPVPKHIGRALADLQDEEKILVRETKFFGKTKREYISLKSPNPKTFSEAEREIVDDVVRGICEQHTAVSISDLSHDIIWEAAEIGEEIPVYAVLAANVGEITAADKKWADGIIKNNKKRAA